ncbi:MAG: efflux RND transporter periplasmic adaptor subunit, partial [Pseudomonadota bacterium]
MRPSIVVAGLIAVGLVGWMASGHPAVRGLFGATPAEPPAAAAPARSELETRVRVTTSVAEPVARELVLYGRTEPHREVTLRAETYGRVVEVLVAKGDSVEAGNPVLRLDPREREVMVDQARALLRQRELEYEAARQLGTRGFQAENRVAEALAQLEAARAELQAREVALAHTTIAAPFGGILDDRMVEIGDFVDTGEVVGHLIEQHPLLVSAEVNETRKRDVRVGMPVEVELADGQRASGELR